MGFQPNQFPVDVLGTLLVPASGVTITATFAAGMTPH